MSNSAAWIVAEKQIPLEVKPADTWETKQNEVLIKNGAVAANPCDWALQEQFLPFEMPYPNILGQDVAGEVVAVGSNVTNFKVGDRVLGHACSMATKEPRDGAFQKYSIVADDVVTKIPDSMTFEEACVFPLTLSTAAFGMYMPGYLELDPPTLDSKPNGKVLVLWGGASSVGCNGIQLAVASGYEVYATCSPKNNDLLKSLGASRVFDYRSESVTQDIIDALKGKTIAGVLACVVDPNAFKSCVEILQASEGNKFISSVLPPKDLPEGINGKWIWADVRNSETAKNVYGKFLEPALAKGIYKVAPEPLVVGKGLENVQKALEVQKKGVSAQKVVVSLS